MNWNGQSGTSKTLVPTFLQRPFFSATTSRIELLHSTGLFRADRLQEEERWTVCLLEVDKVVYMMSNSECKASYCSVWHSLSVPQDCSLNLFMFMYVCFVVLDLRMQCLKRWFCWCRSWARFKFFCQPMLPFLFCRSFLRWRFCCWANVILTQHKCPWIGSVGGSVAVVCIAVLHSVLFDTPPGITIPINVQIRHK